MDAFRGTALTLAAAFALASRAGGAPPRAADPAIPPDYLDSFLPLPERFDIASNPAQRLHSGAVSSSTVASRETGGSAGCHDLERFGDDGRRVSPGHVGQRGRRNAPTVYKVTGARADRMKFRVPGLRNVAETAPDYHAGSLAALDEAESADPLCDEIDSQGELGVLLLEHEVQGVEHRFSDEELDDLVA